MRIVCLSCITLILFTLNGCIFAGDHLSNLWFYTYNTAGEADSLLTPASFLELRPDGSFTRDFGRFEYGSWSRKANQLYLTNQLHVTYVFALNGLTAKEMQLTVGKEKTGNFESQPMPSPTAAEDPFSRDNNQWRIRATLKENDDEIKKRLFNHCQFWEAYFTWALNNKIETIDVRSTPTAIKIYGNGFGLKPFEELPARWKDCFFDEEDCRKSSDLIQDIFQHRNIAWAHTDNKYKLFISAFQQMKTFLR